MTILIDNSFGIFYDLTTHFFSEMFATYVEVGESNPCKPLVLELTIKVYFDFEFSIKKDVDSTCRKIEYMYFSLFLLLSTNKTLEITYKTNIGRL